jgi:2-aminophenol/2-amino-5-chlorophenol 1,6-dioxygenase beta subunit
VPRFESLSVDPIFPNLFRYHYELDVDVELAESIARRGRGRGPRHRHDAQPGLPRRLRHDRVGPPGEPGVGQAHRLDLVVPQRGLFYSVEVMQEQMFALARATRRAVEQSGKRVVLLASESLSHRHFVSEATLPEDMSKEHVTNHHQYLWDMRFIELLRKGKTRQVVDEMPEFTDQAVSESDSGALTWLLAALDYPTYEAELYAYGTVIGTGNAVLGWTPTPPREQGGGAT